MIRTFAPVVILPKFDVSNMAILSLIALVINYYLNDEDINLYSIGFAFVAFGILPFASGFVTLVDAYKYEMIFNYDRIRDFDRILENNNVEIIDKVYDLQVHYTLLIFDKSEIERLKEKYSYLNVTFEEKEQIVTRKPI